MKAWFVALLFLIQALTAQADEPIVAHWAGVGMQATRPFHLDGPGELQWQTSGELFQAMMYKVGDDKTPSIAANQTETGPGTYYIPHGGDYYIRFNALGKWSAQVVAVSSSAPFTATPRSDQTLPSQIGVCSTTTVSSVETRLKGVPGSGSAISFANKGFQVAYETIGSIDNSKPGDPVIMCLVKIPENCPPGDQRGKLYVTVNLRSMTVWAEPDSSHQCGGA